MGRITVINWADVTIKMNRYSCQMFLNKFSAITSSALLLLPCCLPSLMGPEPSLDSKYFVSVGIAYGRTSRVPTL